MYPLPRPKSLTKWWRLWRNPGVNLKVYRTEFKKHVFPRLDKEAIGGGTLLTLFPVVCWDAMETFECIWLFPLFWEIVDWYRDSKILLLCPFIIFFVTVLELGTAKCEFCAGMCILFSFSDLVSILVFFICSSSDSLVLCCRLRVNFFRLACWDNEFYNNVDKIVKYHRNVYLLIFL